MEGNIPNQLKPDLDEIARRLWSNNAAVMVGAGFSQNAHPESQSSVYFPSWSMLGDAFYEKLHQKSLDMETRYLSILKLADEVEAKFGRPVLNELISSNIPDIEHDPSPLHSQLLELPWKDVFTTNYDTLLERACALVTLKNYDIVYTKEDLLYANCPRIVKLHGSFPSSPFIITEEDYRCYPNTHAPFVNTVRQSLIENTLCLIGFSGEDPNFLQWVGWVRDHIGTDTSHKLYFFDVSGKLTDAHRRLFDKRGIVAVDLSVVSRYPETAMKKIFDYLNEQKSHARNWPVGPIDKQPWRAEGVGIEDFVKISEKWRDERVEYPNWVIIPKDRRKVLWENTKMWLLNFDQISVEDCQLIETPFDLELAFGLGWRLDRCLVPLTSAVATFLEEVVEKYSDLSHEFPDESHWSIDFVYEAITIIRLWLLRHYREQGFDDNWLAVRKSIQSDSNNLLPEHKSQLQLEEVLQALFCFSPIDAKRLLTDWESNESQPFWEAKRAALMAELGEVKTAHSILKTSLSKIRQLLRLRPITDDYILVSQESVVMLLLFYVERHLDWSGESKQKSSILSAFSERWNELESYRCNPRYEIELLSAQIQNSRNRSANQVKTHGFDLTRVGHTFNFENFDEEGIAALGFLRMREEFGVPYRIENETFSTNSIKATISKVRPYYPHWALVNIVRLGNANLTDELFDREFLAKLHRDEVDSVLNTYLPAFKRTITALNEPDEITGQYLAPLVKTLPEVFSRLCYKCSPNFRKELVDSLFDIYNSNRQDAVVEAGQFPRRLFNSMSIKERIRIAPSLLDFSVLDHVDEDNIRVQIHPLQLITLPPQVQRNEILIDEEQVSKMLDRLSCPTEIRDGALNSLVWLHENKVLNQEQSIELGIELWSDVEEANLPTLPGSNYFNYLALPHPASIDPVSRVKQHLSSIINKVTSNGFLQFFLSDRHFMAPNIGWTITEVQGFAENFYGWWGQIKHRIPHQTSGLDETKLFLIQHTVRTVTNTLSYMIENLHLNEITSCTFDGIRGFIADLQSYGIPTIKLEAALARYDLEESNLLLDGIRTAMFDSDEKVVVDALYGFRTLIQATDDQNWRNEFSETLTILIHGIRWRHPPGLVTRLTVTTGLIQNQPWCLTSRVTKDLLAGLDQIAKDTSGGIAGNDDGQQISVRSAAAGLAAAVFKFYQDSDKPLPDEIELWHNLCNDPNEFSEIKNSWDFICHQSAIQQQI